MANQKENLKALFTNTRTRVIIIFTLIIVIVTIVIGYFKLSSSNENLGISSASLSKIGNIESVPGSLNPNPEYLKLLQQENINKAKSAAAEGKSAIPTILKTQEIKEDAQSLTPGVQGGPGFLSLSRSGEGGAQKTFWLQTLKNAQCSPSTLEQVKKEGAKASEIKEACTCTQLRKAGYTLEDLKTICSCKELKSLGVNAMQMKSIGFSAGQLYDCGFSACETKAVGYSAVQMKEGGFGDGELKGAGFSPEEIAQASGIPANMTVQDVRKADCDPSALAQLRAQGVSAAAIRRINGCSATQLKAAGFSAQDLKNAGFTPGELRKAGFSNDDLKKAGFSDDDLAPDKNLPTDCDANALSQARQKGISARTIREKLGCDAQEMKAAGFSAGDLKDAGYTAGELKKAGFSAKDLKNAGFPAKELLDAGFSPQELKDAGFSAKELKDAGVPAAQLRTLGFSPQELKDAGFSAQALKDAGVSARDLQRAGFDPDEIKKAGYSEAELKSIGLSSVQGLKGGPEQTDLSSSVSQLPSSERPSTREAQEAANAQQLQSIMDAQNRRLANQQYQQQIQQRLSEMSGAAGTAIQNWSRVSTQVYTSVEAPSGKNVTQIPPINSQTSIKRAPHELEQEGDSGERRALIKAGDILFAVIDTSINSDEPSPILATIVSGRFRGAKLIGSFVLANNNNIRPKKMVINFNTMSVPSAAHSTSISAYAIDANTARTALASNVNDHVFTRYGSLFASSFLEGFGNAFQSADTTVTVGGTNGGGQVTIQNGISRSALENAIIGLATVGKNWGQFAQQQFNRPPTIRVCSGTAIGVLFMRDLTTL